MNRTVHAHIKSIMPKNPDPDAPVFSGGGTRPNNRFRTLCSLAGIEPKMSIEAGEEQRWVLKDLRKTCATYYDEHVPESSVETSWPFRGRRHLPSLCPSRSAGVQGDHDNSATFRFFGIGQRIRRRMPLLQKTLYRHWVFVMSHEPILPWRPMTRPPQRAAEMASVVVSIMRRDAIQPLLESVC